MSVNDLPESEQTRPTKPRAFAELLDRLGVSEEQRAELAVVAVEGEEFAPHAEFESQRDATGRTRYPDPTDCEGMLRIVDDSGPLWVVQCDRCEFEVSIAIGKIDPQRVTDRLLAAAGIPDAFLGHEFEKGDPDQEPTLAACRLWLRQFRPAKLIDSVPAIAVWGKPGRGKSHLLSLMVETLIRKHHVDAIYRSEVRLFDELQHGLDQGAFEMRWQRILRVPVLALDDVGAGRRSEWRRERFATLVDYRYEKGLPLLVATNIPPAGWESAFDDRTASRLRGICVRFELQGKDRRVSSQASLLEAA